MLVDTSKKPVDDLGFNPNTDNTITEANPSTGEKIGWICLIILGILTIIGGIILLIFVIKWNNWFNEQQIAINTAASNIDVSLTKRRDTLVKMLEQAKSYYKYEGDVQTQITQLRSMNFSNRNQALALLDKIQSGFNLTVENYPNLKANQVIIELMSTSQFLESEIAASRRVYNAKVQAFNGAIYTFPKIMVAHKMKLHNFLLFAASAIQKQDVDMSSLSNY